MVEVMDLFDVATEIEIEVEIKEVFVGRKR